MGPKLRERRKEDNGLLHSTRFHSTSIIPSAPHGEGEKGCQMRVQGGVGCGRYPIPSSAL
jgi:hypothetical protein